MLSLTVFGSSSSGNCFELSSSTTTIMLDCGLYNEYIYSHIKKTNGIVLSHRHLDHTKGIKKIKDYYKEKYYSNDDTISSLPVLQEQTKIVESGVKFEIGDFMIMPFEVYHDVKNYGYLIKDKISNMKILYIIDTSNISNLHFKDVDVFIIEANHSWQWLMDKEEMDAKDYRTFGEQGHLDIESCIEFLQENININTKKIILTHISRGFEDYESFATIVKESLIGIANEDIEVYAINPKLKKPLEIKLKNDIEGFDFI